MYIIFPIFTFVWLLDDNDKKHWRDLIDNTRIDINETSEKLAMARETQQSSMSLSATHRRSATRF
jgi:hypothetical protein